MRTHPITKKKGNLQAWMNQQKREALQTQQKVLASMIHYCLDRSYYELCDIPQLHPDLKDALTRVQLLARMLRGPGDDSGSDR